LAPFFGIYPLCLFLFLGVLCCSDG